jgi:hypothetical protein
LFYIINIFFFNLLEHKSEYENTKDLLKAKELTLILFIYIIEQFIEKKYELCFYIIYQVFNKNEDIDYEI